ncbi:(2,3-dihydroxybenzoyl)adenylate synthase [Veronia nyctiphanis]|uniref:(2,3-dihydroxybenzoyl)adenylate synthase n=1 Tax=Veronia nyctiphanis TaxID=1278244 RepID=A0A4V1LT09_9GAMM|nr:(2,3-dihydroxybenzoyl)adenylate synthase [Veronia nyctiphanis]RXJ73558.1 (2,3-dihydroxybenzoyl)adenylate synthase [Veronia nyctiphanis]
MRVNYTPWPEDEAKRYREKGFWLDLQLTDILDRHLTSQGSKTAIITDDSRLTYAELALYSTRLAASLAKRGLKAGDTALVQLPNDFPFYVVYFALLRLGVVPVNALFNHNREELSHYAKQLEPKLVIGSELQPLFKTADFTNQLRENEDIAFELLVDGNVDFAPSLRELWLNEETDISCVPKATGADEVAFFQLSGGSTGTPKLIPRTHNDYYYSVRQSVDVCEWEDSVVYLCALPAAHNFPLSSPGALGVFFAGGTLVIAPDPSPSTCFPLIKQHGVNWTALVPPAAILWLNAPDGAEALASLKYLQVGGARLSTNLAKRVESELDVTLQQVFGMAEGLVNYTRLDDDEWTRHNTQGRPMSEDDVVVIVDEDGEPVKQGEEGLLTTKGPYTFRGYFNADTHNRKAFTDQGYYASGDVVVQTETGHLTVVGRDKDQINKGGEKIAAEELENHLLSHPDVFDAAVVSMPDELLGERICAFIIVKKGCAVRPVTLNKFMRSKHLADYKYPDRYELIDAFPKTKVGKVDKKSLRAHIATLLAKRTPPSRTLV